MIKKLLILIRLFFSKKQNQNTPTFTGTELFGNNAKWLCFVFFVFQVGFGQTCNVVTNPTFTGNANGWTLGGSGVGWYYEATWAPGEIYIERDGAVDQSLRQNLTGLINNSLTLSFKIKGQNANRLSTCPTTASIVIKLGGNTYMTINNPAGSIGSPNTQITTANITTSNGATYTQTGFPLTVGGATSGITITQGIITLTIPWNPAISTIADLEFVATSSSTPSGSCLAWGGDDWFLDDIMLYTSNPVAYNMTGTSICEGSSTTIGLSNSQLGVNYQLYRNGSTAVGSPVAGTGTAISFGSQNVIGVYTAIATAGTTGCTTPMNGSVSINPNPTLTNAAQPAAQPAVCAGSVATINLTGLLPSTTSTINYTINGVAQTAITGVVSNVSGAGSFTTPVLTIANNGQILQITGITNTSATPNCTSSFARNVTLAVNPIPTLTGASQPIAACVGSGATINLTGLLPSVTSTISYSINGVAQTAVTGVISDASGAASFSTVALTAANNGQQLRITGVATTSTTPNCSASFTQNVTLSVNPAVTLTGAAQSVAVCAGFGALINLTGLPVNSTSTINYTINSVAQTAITGVVANGSGAASFTSAVLTAANNGQQLRITGVTVTSSTPNCSATFTQNVTLVVNPVLTASVSISTSPAGTICAGTSVTFTANPTNPGTTPVYQWKLNGVNVGTNSTTYSNSTLLLNNDVVTCEMTSNASPCLTGSPATSNAITVASAGPTTTGVNICAGSSGSLTSSTACANGSNQTSGPNNARAATNNTNVGTIAWTNPGNITTVGTPYATLAINNNNSATTNYLIGSNYDFSTIPSNAIIGGITVVINRRTSNTGSIVDNAIRIVKGGILGATNKSSGAVWSTSGFTTVTYGGTSDLWGTTWNVSDIQNSNFGVALSALISTNNTRTLSVDYMQITITYAVPGSIDWYTTSSGGTFLGSGASFNPVGVAGSGLANTNTAGSTIFYAECSSNPGCRTPATFVIRATPTATISGTASVCQGAASPNITFTNPLSEAITVTYNINGGTNETINVAANATATVAAPTGTSGTFVYNLVSAVYQSGTACSANITGSATVTVRATPSATISGTTTVCQGSTAPNITFTNPLSAAITVTYNINGGTTGTVNVGANTTATVAAPTGTSGTFVYNLVSAIYQSGTACSATVTGSATIIINPTPSAPTVGTVTHISCTANTGSVVLGDLPNGNWTINQTGYATATYNNTIANTTSTTISGLAAGTYTFIVANASGCPSGTSSVSILDNSNTWNGSSWSKGVPPNASMNVIITSVTPSSPFTVDLVGCALTINSGVVATVPTGITLTITNEVAVYGQLTFENNASLVQINNVANVGPIIYKRNSQPMKNFDYTYWSSPVEGQTFYNFSPNTLWDKYLSFTGTVWQEELGSTIMKPGIGYIIRVPKPNSVYMNGKDYWTGSSYIQQVEFTGRPNNGNITSSQYMEKDKYYLIGNPYPSAIHADDFLYNNVNNRAILGGTVYFWTHNTAIKVVNSKLAYVSDDYASYNLTGGTATRAALSPGLNTEIPQGYIAAGQSFFTSAEDGSGYVEFTNAMRYGETYNGQFFKPGKTSKPARMEKHRLWLNMTNSGGVYKQTLIGYIEGATNTYDKSFDGLSFDGNSYVDFYSINAADNLTIQGRSLPFMDTDVVPLGYRSTIAGDFTIAIDKADGNLATQRVYLEDKQTGTISELTAGNYTFTTKAGTFNNRFVLRYTNKTLGTGDFETTGDAVSVFIQNKTITVNSTVENIDKVFIYDISGKHLYKKEEVNNLQLIIQNLPFAQQVLLVKVVLDNGYQTTKKVIFK